VKALICGVGGQDGGYLAKLLLGKDYKVVGTSRDAMIANFGNLARLGIADQVKTTSMAISDFRSVLNTIVKYQPDEIYNLAGQTSVELSFGQPVEAMESILGGTLNILEAIRFVGRPIRFYSAGSSECFGDTSGLPASEVTPFSPRSPYAVAKASSHWLVSNYRQGYGLFACTGILFNHESTLRPIRFVTQKIVQSAIRIANGSNELLELGRLDVSRDWGWAPEYVDAMWRMLQQQEPLDFVIATGKTHTLGEFIEATFGTLGLDWEKYVRQSPDLVRPTDIASSSADPSAAARDLGWTAKLDMYGVVNRMLNGSIE
jgi:GDPmannose 4,6-dehydratase